MDSKYERLGDYAPKAKTSKTCKAILVIGNENNKTDRNP